MILLVCGFGRCGSSLVMQMLAAGGYPVAGSYPDYEDGAAMLGLPAEEWEERFSGRAFKLLDPHIFTPPIGPIYRSIWIDRQPGEWAKSQLKFLGAMRAVQLAGRRARRSIEASYQQDRPKALAALRRLDSDPFTLTFESLIESPEQSANRLMQAAARPLDVERMVAAVWPRSSACYPVMLEGMLLAEQRGRASLLARSSSPSPDRTTDPSP